MIWVHCNCFNINCINCRHVSISAVAYYHLDSDCFMDMRLSFSKRLPQLDKKIEIKINS